MIYGIKLRERVSVSLLIVFTLPIAPISLPRVPNFLFLVTVINPLLNYIALRKRILPAGVPPNIDISTTLAITG